jgi:hypothetical protein
MLLVGSGRQCDFEGFAVESDKTFELFVLFPESLVLGLQEANKLRLLVLSSHVL